MNIGFEPIEERNASFLRDMIYEAVYVPENEERPPLSIIDDPGLSKYWRDWGRPGDLGLAAVRLEQNIGAIWIRYFDADHPGYGFIRNDIPELAMALRQEYRDKGIGTELMIHFLTICRERGIDSVSMSVDRRNRATEFYRRMGAVTVAERANEVLMRIDLIR